MVVSTLDPHGKVPMAVDRALYAVSPPISCACALACTLAAQEVPVPQLTPGSARKPAAAAGKPVEPQTVALTVAKGAPLQVALDEEIRVKKVGQPVHARIVEPVYAFDHIVVPVGSEVVGEITKIEPLSQSKRTLAALNADFMPLRKVEVGFYELVLPDGRRFPLHASVTPGSGQIIELVTSANEKEKTNRVQDMASEKIKEAKQQAHQEWDNPIKELTPSAKIPPLQ